jgi:hypothetical protein
MEAMNKDWFETSKGLVDKDTIIFPLQPPGAEQDCHDNDTSCFVTPIVILPCGIYRSNFKSFSTLIFRKAYSFKINL